MLNVSVNMDNMHESEIDENIIKSSVCINNIGVSVGVNDVHASGTDPEECGEDCEGNSDPISCFSTYDHCGWFGTCTTFWRCNPNGNCFSASGKNLSDPNIC